MEEKVIIRREYDPYRKEWSYLAGFPEASANPGRILCLPFRMQEDGSTIYEAHCEVGYDYYYKTKIVHAKTEEAEKCRAAIEKLYNSDGGETVHLRLAEKNHKITISCKGEKEKKAYILLKKRKHLQMVLNSLRNILMEV